MKQLLFAKFPFTDEVIKKLGSLDPYNRGDISVSDIANLENCFASLSIGDVLLGNGIPKLQKQH